MEEGLRGRGGKEYVDREREVRETRKGILPPRAL